MLAEGTRELGSAADDLAGRVHGPQTDNAFFAGPSQLRQRWYGVLRLAWFPFGWVVWNIAPVFARAVNWLVSLQSAHSALCLLQRHLRRK
jgi:hypothetical protein